MRKLISILIMLSIMFNISVFSALSYETEAPLITSGNYYYIKNLQSGKYLDVEYANDSNGANVSQYHFTGGYYKLYPRCSSTRCLNVYTANGYNRSNIDIYEDSGNASRKFSIKLNSDVFRIEF